ASAKMIRNTAEIYDPATDTWTAVGSMHYRRAAHAAVLLHDGSVLVTGGYDGASVLSTADRFVPDKGAFVQAWNMGMQRERFDATLLFDGRVLVPPDPVGTMVAIIYDPIADQWSPTAPMAAPRNGPPTLLLSGRILV